MILLLRTVFPQKKTSENQKYFNNLRLNVARTTENNFFIAYISYFESFCFCAFFLSLSLSFSFSSGCGLSIVCLELYVQIGVHKLYCDFGKYLSFFCMKKKNEFDFFFAFWLMWIICQIHRFGN